MWKEKLTQPKYQNEIGYVKSASEEIRKTTVLYFL